jgi:hypothetical protein
MNTYFKKYSISIILSVIMLFSLTRLVWGWTNPSANPPSGSGSGFSSLSSLIIDNTNGVIQSKNITTDAGQNLTIHAGDTTQNTTGQAGGNLVLRAGNPQGGSNAANGGSVTINSGTGTGTGGNGGAITIATQSGVAGGTLTLSAGTGNSSGNVNITTADAGLYDSGGITLQTGNPGSFGGTHNPGSISFITAGATRVKINGIDGSVGIGTTTTSTYKLNVDGIINATDIYKNGVAFVSGGSSVPANTISAFYLTNCPTGWILANGSSGTPDLRGVFIRGAGTNGTYKNANNSYFTATFGTEQNDEFQGHSHYITKSNGNSLNNQQGVGPALGTRNDMVLNFSGPNDAYTYVAQEISSDPTNGTPRIGAETRPANYALIYCMKTSEDSAPSNSIWGTSGNDVVIQDTAKNVLINSNGIKFSDGSIQKSAGTIIQMQTLTNTGQYSQASDTFAEITSAWRLAITPKFSTSKLLLRASFSVNTVAVQVSVYKFFDVTNAANVCVGSALGSRRPTTIVLRGPAYDVNDAVPATMECVINATNTTTRTYTIYGSRENPGSGTFYFNYSAGDSSVYGWTAPFTFTITEIAQ